MKSAEQVRSLYQELIEAPREKMSDDEKAVADTLQWVLYEDEGTELIQAYFE